MYRDQHDDDRRALRGLCDGDDEQDYAGDRRANGVDRRACAPAGGSQPHPTPDHAGLRQRERHEDADHVEGDERVRIAAEEHEQDGGKALSPRIPFEKASRSPWFMSWRGTYRSRARIEASLGKSA